MGAGIMTRVSLGGIPYYSQFPLYDTHYPPGPGETPKSKAFKRVHCCHTCKMWTLEAHWVLPCVMLDHRVGSWQVESWRFPKITKISPEYRWEGRKT